MLLSHFCSSIPYHDNYKLKDKIYYGIRMETRAYSCLTELFELFYSPITQSESKISYKKIVPLDIYNLLTPMALAY
jgi:LAGLIDADG DNA endonuclease family